MLHLKQQLESGAINLNKQERDQLIQQKMDQLAKATTFESLAALADPDVNDGISVTFERTRDGKFVAMYGREQLFQDVPPFSSPADVRKKIEEGIRGNVDLYAAYTMQQEDRQLAKQRTEAEIADRNTQVFGTTESGFYSYNKSTGKVDKLRGGLGFRQTGDGSGGGGFGSKALTALNARAEHYRKLITDYQTSLQSVDPKDTARVAGLDQQLQNAMRTLDSVNAQIDQRMQFEGISPPKQNMPTVSEAASKAGVQVGKDEDGQVLYQGAGGRRFTTEAEALATFKKPSEVKAKNEGLSSREKYMDLHEKWQRAHEREQYWANRGDKEESARWKRIKDDITSQQKTLR
jgi:hypothetical protein